MLGVWGWLALGPAWAVTGDLQVAMFRPALEVGAAAAEAADPSWYLADVGDTVSCWDRVGVTDFNLSVPVDTVGLAAEGGVLSVEVALGEVYGEQMGVYGLDEDYFDACPEFDGTLVYARVTDARLGLALEPVRGPDGGLAFDLAEAPVLTGDLDTDFDWVPDDLILFFVEDLLWAEISAALSDSLPPALADALAGPLYDDTLDGYAVQVSLVDASATGGTLAIGLDTALEYVGTPACPVPAGGASAGGRAPALPLDGRDGEHLGLGLTEEALNDLLFAAWKAGAFCYRPEEATRLAEKLARLVDPQVVGISVLASVESPPVLRAGADGLRLGLDAQRVQVTGRLDGEDVTLVDATLSLEAAASLAPDPSIGALVVRPTDIRVDVLSLRVDHALPGTDGALRAAVRAWLGSAMTGAVGAIPVLDAVVRTDGLVARAERTAAVDGGAEVYIRLYDPNDPAVDPLPPDTAASLAERSGSRATVAWSGTDDRAGALSYAYNVDDAGWSSWTTDAEVTVDNLWEGDHTIQVKARDAWLNEDPTPAVVSFTVSADDLGPGGVGCGCGAAGGAGSAVLAVGAAVALGWRRRRPAA